MSAGRKKQDSLDRYDTPPEVTRAFLQAFEREERWWGVERLIIWEPSAGSGAMIGPLRETYPDAEICASDLYPRAEGVREVDFLDTDDAPAIVDMIITNPPFRLAEQFLRHAMKVIADEGTVILLLRAGFLESRRRENLLEEFPPSEVYFLRSRPKFTGPNTNGGTDTAMYAWFVWRKGERPDHFEGHIL